MEYSTEQLAEAQMSAYCVGYFEPISDQAARDYLDWYYSNEVFGTNGLLFQSLYWQKFFKNKQPLESLRGLLLGQKVDE